MSFLSCLKMELRCLYQSKCRTFFSFAYCAVVTGSWAITCPRDSYLICSFFHSIETLYCSLYILVNDNSEVGLDAQECGETSRDNHHLQWHQGECSSSYLYRQWCPPRQWNHTWPRLLQKLCCYSIAIPLSVKFFRTHALKTVLLSCCVWKVILCSSFDGTPLIMIVLLLLSIFC